MFLRKALVMDIEDFKDSLLFCATFSTIDSDEAMVSFV